MTILFFFEFNREFFFFVSKLISYVSTNIPTKNCDGNVRNRNE